MDDGEPESDGDNDKIPGNPMGVLQEPRGCKGGCRPEGSQGPMATVAPVFTN